MDIKVNETPVRTSRNFRINNISIENVNIPSKLDEFKNVNITSENTLINSNEEKINLVYGNGDILLNNINKEKNSSLKITTTGKNSNIKIIFTFDDKNLDLVNDILLDIKHDSNIIIQYISNTNKECFHNGVLKLIARKSVKANISIVNILNNNSYNFDSIENDLEEDSNLKYTIVDFGGKYSVSNYYSNIYGDSAKNDLKSVYLGIDNQVKDINYIAHLKGKKTDINIDVQGALKDCAKKNFKGTIDFKRGCKKAKGDENEFCILLSPKAKSIALPMLLCTEDDVEGNHSTASGKVDEKSLFYIMSRGFSEKEAIKLIVRARFNKIIERIKDDKIKEEILSQIDERLN